MNWNNLLKSLIRSILKIFVEKFAIKFQHSSQQSIVVALLCTLSLVLLVGSFWRWFVFQCCFGFCQCHGVIDTASLEW